MVRVVLERLKVGTDGIGGVGRMWEMVGVLEEHGKWVL